MVLEAARFQMSRKKNAFNEWMVTTAQQHQRDGLDEEALKVGFKAGFTRGTLSEMSKQLRHDERGDGHVPRDSGYDKGKRDGYTEASGGKGGSGVGEKHRLRNEQPLQSSLVRQTLERDSNPHRYRQQLIDLDHQPL